MAVRKRIEKSVKTESRTLGNQRSTGKSKKSPLEFPVVGIGASAGGLEAFRKFFVNLPSDTGMAFVINQHLDPTHVSNMVEILGRYTRIPVLQAEDGMELEPNHVYMIPPNRDMTIIDHSLKIIQTQEYLDITHSIDPFFRSLAQDLKDKAIAVILSGTGTDGTMGAKAVKAGLGMVMVQDPEDADYNGMPEAAISSGVADYVLPAGEMPQRLMAYVEKYYGKITLRREALEKESAKFSQILGLIRTKTGHDFSSYKQDTILRRVERRMVINQVDTLSDYLKVIRNHPAEIDLLIKDFLIKVTSFFRDPEAFRALKEQLKVLLADKPEGYEVRAWVPGCSTGEEPYSITIAIEECLEELTKHANVQVFGTDLDGDAIASARVGLFPLSIAVDIGEERLKRFFDKTAGQYQVKRELREKLIFAVQDITPDPPFTRMDLISARNLLINFDANLQKKLIPLFHYALKEGGLLFLGTAEAIGEFANSFSALDQKWRIYRAEKKGLPVPTPGIGFPPWPYVPPRRSVEESQPQEITRGGSPEQVMLEALPPSILLDSNYQILFTHGDTRKYISLPEGEPKTGILQMVRPEMGAFLVSGLHVAATQRREVVFEAETFLMNGTTNPVRMVIKPVTPSMKGEPISHFIVTFQELSAKKPRKKGSRQAPDGRSQEMEQELQFTKETLRGTIEELETANEELRSANEEYQSTNEELQSTNEELETSREELQSVNEELNTVNAENEKKIEELSSLDDDLRNLLTSTGVATIFLDENLKLRRFTPNAIKIFNLIDADIGRPITDITHRLKSDVIAEQVKRVLNSLIPMKEDIEAQDGKWYSMRIHPYRTAKNTIKGVGITLVDLGDRERILAAN